MAAATAAAEQAVSDEALSNGNVSVHEEANGEDTHDVQQRHIEALRQQRDMLQQMVEQRKQV